MTVFRKRAEWTKINLYASRNVSQTPVSAFESVVDAGQVKPLGLNFAGKYRTAIKHRPNPRNSGDSPLLSQAARAYLRGMLQKAGIEKKISPHKLRHTYATNLLNAGAERVGLQALLGHESIATTQIYTNVGQERMEQVVARL